MRLAKIGFCFFITVMQSISASGQSEHDAREQIWKHLSGRRRAAETAEVTWTMSLVKSTNASADDPDIEIATAGEFAPPAAKCRLVLSGPERVRLEYPTRFVASDGNADLVSSIRTYDGELNWGYDDMGGRDGLPNQGSVTPRPVMFGRSSTQFLPLYFALRPFWPEAFGESVEGWEFASDPSSVDGRRCVVLEQRPSGDGNSLRCRVYLDTGRDFVPLRAEWQSAGSKLARIQIDMRYERQQEPVWVPSHWKAIWYTDGGQLLEQSTNDLISVNLGSQVTDQMFLLEFPPGTLVRDRRKRPYQSAVVADDGQFVPRRQVEAEATAGGTKWWPWLATAGAAVLGGALLLWRRAAGGV